MRFSFITCILFILQSCNTSGFLKKAAKVPLIEKSSPTKTFKNDAEILLAYLNDSYPKGLHYDSLRFSAAADNYRKEIKTIKTEKHFQFSTQRLLASLNDGHSFVSSIPYLPSDKMIFPIRIIPVNGSLFLWNLDKSYDSLNTGRKLRSINGIIISEIIKRITEYESGETIEWKLHRAKDKFYSPVYWEALGIPLAFDSLNIEFEDQDIASILVRKKSLKNLHFYNIPADNFKKSSPFNFYIDKQKNYAFLQMNTSLDLVAFRSALSDYFKFPIKQAVKKFSKSKLPPDFGHVVADFFSEVHHSGVSKVILDLRYNSGGEPLLGKQFLYYLNHTHLNNEELNLKFSKTFRKTFPELTKRALTEAFSQDIATKFFTAGDTIINLNQHYTGSSFFQDLFQNPQYYLDKKIPKFNGTLIVLTGPSTFSAGHVLSSIIQDNKIGLAIGESTGNKAQHPTYFTLIKLPKSKMVIQLSAAIAVRPDYNLNGSFLPNVFVCPTIGDLLNGKDATLVKAIEY